MSPLFRRINVTGLFRSELHHSATQNQLAKLSGVSQSLIAKLESGNIDPSYSKTTAILNALDSIEKKGVAKAEEIMSKGLISVSPKAKVSVVIKLMKDNEISQLPVLENLLVVGSVSEKSILDAISKGEKITLESPVEEVMDEPFPQLDQGVSTNLVAELLKYNSAVLLTKKGKITGIVTKSDLLKTIR